MESAMRPTTGIDTASAMANPNPVGSTSTTLFNHFDHLHKKGKNIELSPEFWDVFGPRFDPRSFERKSAILNRSKIVVKGTGPAYRILEPTVEFFVESIPRNSTENVEFANGGIPRD